MFCSLRSVFFGALAICAPAVASAATLYSDDFNSNTSSNYNTYITAGATGPSGDTTFAYDYGAAPGSGGLSLPLAPHTTDGSSLGLRLRTDNLQSSVGTVVGATSVVTKNLSLPSSYQVQVDVWTIILAAPTFPPAEATGPPLREWASDRLVRVCSTSPRTTACSSNRSATTAAAPIRRTACIRTALTRTRRPSPTGRPVRLPRRPVLATPIIRLPFPLCRLRPANPLFRRQRKAAQPLPERWASPGIPGRSQTTA